MKDLCGAVVENGGKTSQQAHKQLAALCHEGLSAVENEIQNSNWYQK